MRSPQHSFLVLFSVFILLLLSSCQTNTDDHNLKLWYNKPASIWEEAVPIGNGKTGAMVFGGITSERYQLNDITLWSGFPEDGNNSSGPEILKKTRELISKGDYAKASVE